MSSYSQFFSKKIQHICVSLKVNFNESLTNDVVIFEQLGPEWQVSYAVQKSRSIYDAKAEADHWVDDY